MTAANIIWTKRASKRLREIVVYIATNFYPDYALAFRDDALDTANTLADNPELGEEAFPVLKRPATRPLTLSSGIYCTISSNLNFANLQPTSQHRPKTETMHTKVS